MQTPKIMTWINAWRADHIAAHPNDGWPVPGSLADRTDWAAWFDLFRKHHIIEPEARAASRRIVEALWCEHHPAALLAIVQDIRAEPIASERPVAATVALDDSPEARMDRAARALAEYYASGWKLVYRQETNRFYCERANPDAPALTAEMWRKLRDHAYEMRILLGKPWPTYEECLRPDGSFDWRLMAAKMGGSIGRNVRTEEKS